MTRRSLSLVLLVVTLLLAGCGGAGSSETSPLERETFDLVNEFRVDQGLEALVWNDDIARVCRDHSRDMASGVVDFGHDGFEDRVAELTPILGFSGAAENVHHNLGMADPAQVAVDGWLASPGHRANILGPYELSGMGVAEAAEGEFYFTQMFWVGD